MKPWNAHENSAGHVNEPMWRAFAAKLRDWLDVLLEQRAVTAALEAEMIDAPERIRGDSSVVGPQSRDEVESGSRTEANGNVASWKETAPPEHWLRLVRGGAPELVRPLEEGREPLSGTGEPETPSGSSLSYSEAPVPEVYEHASKDVRSVSKAALSRKNWLSRALRRLLPYAVAEEGKQDVAQKRRNQLTSEVRGAPTRVSSQLSARNSPQEIQSTKGPVVESTSEPMLKRNAGSSPPNREMHSQQTAKGVFANASVKRGTSEGQAGRKNEDASVPSRNELDRRSDVDLNRVGSYSVARPQDFAWASLGARANASISKSSEGLRHAPKLRPNPTTWIPLPDSARNLGNQTQEMLRRDAVSDRNLRVELPATRKFDAHTTDPLGWPESEQSDSWPELPEDSRVNAPVWREALRASDRVRALDLEQKGGC